jgi:predicted CoA-substrate-specific enzyme activase
MKIAGLDIGSTTVKAVVVEDGEVIWKRYERHNTRQAETARDLLAAMEDAAGLTPGKDYIALTGSGSGTIAPFIGGAHVQEVVAVSAAVEKLHPDVRFVSEIGGEDMKTIFFTPTHAGTAKQVYMQSACSGGTGTFIEKSARKLGITGEELNGMGHAGISLHKISAKCGIFAEADANSLLKAGVPKAEIIASLFEAVVRQNLATLTKGNTPLPNVLLLGGPNMFFRGLREAWAHHLTELWKSRGTVLPEGFDAAECIQTPEDALYYACLGCAEIAGRDLRENSRYAGLEKLDWWIAVGQNESKAREGRGSLSASEDALAAFRQEYAPGGKESPRVIEGPVFVGCDFGSTTVKAVVLSEELEVLASVYRQSVGNPIEDAKALFAGLSDQGVRTVAGLGITGYGKDLLKDILGADEPVVETVAHAAGALHFFPDADAICDVGGADVKIMLLRQGTVADFRLNSQCSSGNGAFLQGVAERYGVDLNDYADKAFAAKSMPDLMMGCGVFLQSDIVNQQRKGWKAEEIMAALASVLPLNVWIYAGQFQNLRSVGRKFVLQGGTHRNLAVVKAQVDFIRDKVPDADVQVHPMSGEAGAFGAALLAAQNRLGTLPSRFIGFDRVASLEYETTTNEQTTCRWCAVNCKRAFIDVKVPGGKGRPKSKIPVGEGWERVITGNSCTRGLIEDATEYRERLADITEAKNAHPNTAERVREDAFR